MAQPVVVFSSCSDEVKAQTIAVQLVEQRLAACVNVVSGIKSVYRWEGKLRTESELLLIIKSERDQVQSIRQVVQELSGYELPELIAIEIIDGSEQYLDWLTVESRPLASENTPE
jgi:periplasmic divalent cation tolerance protein